VDFLRASYKTTRGAVNY